MVAEIFETISSAITGFASAVSSAVSSIVAMFWTPAESGTGGDFTFLGTLLLVGLGAGLVYLAIRLIYRAVKGVA